MDNCIFCKIRDKVIAKDFIYENENVMVFPDLNPLKEIHLLIIPKKHISDFSKLEDKDLTNSLREVTQKMIKEQNLEDKGYRVTVNGGGAQIINHLHIHLLGPLGKNVKM